MISTTRMRELCTLIKEMADRAMRVGCPDRSMEGAHDTPAYRIDVMRYDLGGILTAVRELQVALAADDNDALYGSEE